MGPQQVAFLESPNSLLDSCAHSLGKRKTYRMEAIRKQASKLREQVAKQQQAVLKQFGSGVYGGLDGVVAEEVELRQHQKLKRLYISTRAGKHFQRDIVRGVEGYIVTGSKQVEIGTKMAEDSKKYGSESTCAGGSILERSALSFARFHSQMEKERANLLNSLGTQVAEPLRAMVIGAPLEEARILAQQYDKFRQDTESQAIEVSKCQVKIMETPGNAENAMKLEAAEVKLRELRSNMGKLGKEASASMSAVEAQQQRLTLHRLISMVEAEMIYHQRVLQILELLEGEMISERQRSEGPPEVHDIPLRPSDDDTNWVQACHSSSYNSAEKKVSYLLGEVMQPYEAESEGELNLAVGDFVVIRKVTSDGWAEGECKGRAGWFPFNYVERRDRVLASKMAEVF